MKFERGDEEKLPVDKGINSRDMGNKPLGKKCERSTSEDKKGEGTSISRCNKYTRERQHSTDENRVSISTS